MMMMQMASEQCWSRSLVQPGGERTAVLQASGSTAEHLCLVLRTRHWTYTHPRHGTTSRHRWIWLVSFHTYLISRVCAAVMPNMSHCQITRSTRFARHMGIIKPNPNPNPTTNPNFKLNPNLYP